MTAAFSKIERLSVAQFCIDNLPCGISNVIHLLYPCHLINCLEGSCNTIALGHLLYQPKKQSFSLFINIRKITSPFIVCKQIRIENFTVLFEITQMLLSPYALWAYFL